MDQQLLREQLTEIADIVAGMVGYEYLYFPTALTVKLTPHTPEIDIWAVAVSPAWNVYLMQWLQPEPGNNAEDWHQIEACDQNAQIIIPSLYQRVKLLKQQYEIKSKSKQH